MLKFFKKNKLVVRIAAAVLFVGGLVMFLLSSCTPAGKTYAFEQDGITVELAFNTDKTFKMYYVLSGEKTALTPKAIDWRIEKGMVQNKFGTDFTDFGKCVGPVFISENSNGDRITFKSAGNTAVFVVGIVLGVVGLAAEGVLCYTLYVKKD